MITTIPTTLSLTSQPYLQPTHQLPYPCARTVSAPSLSSNTSSAASDVSMWSQYGPQHDSCHAKPGVLQGQRPRTREHHSARLDAAVAPELRKNPRRTSSSNTSRGCPPALTRQAERKDEFVEKLVDSAALIIEAIWPLASVVCRDQAASQPFSLQFFITETLKRSRTSYSTLQVGLYYLMMIKPHVPPVDFTMEQTDESNAKRPLQCGRRMFLAALILSSKWLQDRNYSSRAWSKISGLSISEINENEIAFLTAVGWALHVKPETYNTWNSLILKHTPSLPPPPPRGGSLAVDETRACKCDAFKQFIRFLEPNLDNANDFKWGNAFANVRAAPRRTLSQPRPTSRKHMPVLRATSSYQLTSQTAAGCSNTVPSFMEPKLLSAGSPEPLLQVPALGLLPTARTSTPQPSHGFGTPAASAASRLLVPSLAEQCAGRFLGADASRVPRSSADFNPVLTRRVLDWHQVVENGIPPRRTSFADSVTLASSPESMVSDHSDRSAAESHSSSNTLATSVHSDSQSSILASALSGPMLSKPVWAEQDYNNTTLDTSSPITLFTGSSESVAVRLANEGAYLATEREAAHALQELHKYQEPHMQYRRGNLPAPTSGAFQGNQYSHDRQLSTQHLTKKRSCDELDAPVQHTVRELLASHLPASRRCKGSQASSRDGQEQFDDELGGEFSRAQKRVRHDRPVLATCAPLAAYNWEGSSRAVWTST